METLKVAYYHFFFFANKQVIVRDKNGLIEVKNKKIKCLMVWASQMWVLLYVILKMKIFVRFVVLAVQKLNLMPLPWVLGTAPHVGSRCLLSISF